MYIYTHIYIYIFRCIYIYISYSGEKTTTLSKKYFDLMSSTVLLQLNFYLQKFVFHIAKINHLNHL